MRQTELHLTEEDRTALKSFRSKGLHLAREVNRAHILLALDEKVPEALIVQVLGVGRTAIWRTRSAYVEKGLDYALHDVARPGQPRQYGTDQQAEVVALACSAPPRGAKRWTIQLLTKAARRRPKLRNVNRESIRRFLKKRPQALAQADVVYWQNDRGVSPKDVRFVGALRNTLSGEGAGDLRGRKK